MSLFLERLLSAITDPVLVIVLAAFGIIIFLLWKLFHQQHSFIRERVDLLRQENEDLRRQIEIFKEENRRMKEAIDKLAAQPLLSEAHVNELESLGRRFASFADSTQEMFEGTHQAFYRLEEVLQEESLRSNEHLVRVVSELADIVSKIHSDYSERSLKLASEARSFLKE